MAALDEAVESGQPEIFQFKGVKQVNRLPAVIAEWEAAGGPGNPFWEIP